MKKRENKSPSRSAKRALTSSVLALVLCFVMLLGTTFAWFTDTASTGINKIESGNLKMGVYYEKAKDEWAPIDGATGLFKNVNGEGILWEPGVTATETIKIVNEGNLALQYEFYLNYKNASKTDDGKTLADVLTCGLTGYVSDASVTSLEEIVTYNYLLPGQEIKIPVYIKWEPSANDNDYNVEGGLSIDVGISVYATQYTYEFDSNDNLYDKDAPLPEIVDEGGLDTTKTDDNKFTVTKIEGIQGNNFFYVNGGHYITSDTLIDLAAADESFDAVVLEDTTIECGTLVEGKTGNGNHTNLFIENCDITVSDYIVDGGNAYIFVGTGVTINGVAINKRNCESVIGKYCNNNGMLHIMWAADEGDGEPVSVENGLPTSGDGAAAYKADLSEIVDTNVKNGYMVADNMYVTDGTLLTFDTIYDSVLLDNVAVECKDLFVLNADNTVILADCDITLAEGGKLVVNNTGNYQQVCFKNVTINGTLVTNDNVNNIVSNYCEGEIMANVY